MSDTARESNYTTDTQAKPVSLLSKLNPLTIADAEIRSLVEPAQAPHQPMLKAGQAKEDFSDTKDNLLITVTQKVLHREDIKTLNRKIDQIEDICGGMVSEIYSNSKKPPRCRSEAQLAVKQLPVNVTDENQKDVEALFDVLHKDGYIAPRNINHSGMPSFYRNINHSGMPSFYDEAYGRFISDGIGKADKDLGKTLNESLNYFKGQVKTAKNEFDKIETIHDNQPMVSTSEKLRSIASHAVNMIIALERSKNWLNKLDVAEIDKSYDDIVMEQRQKSLEQQQAREKEQQQQMARAEEAVVARPYKDSLELLSPYGDLADHVKAVDDQVTKIKHEVNPPNAQEFVYYPIQQTMPVPLGHVSGPVFYSAGDDPFQSYNEFKVRGDLRKLSDAIKAVKEDLKLESTNKKGLQPNNGSDDSTPLERVQNESSNDKYSPVLNEAGKPEVNAEVKSRLGNFRGNATKMFTKPNRTEDELEKMCAVGEKVNREVLMREVNSVYAAKDYQALRNSCDDVLKEVKAVSDQYENIRRSNMSTP